MDRDTLSKIVGAMTGDRSSRSDEEVGQTLDNEVDVLARRRTPETEADGAHAHLRRDTHGVQNRRQLDPAGVTRRSRRGRDTIEPLQYLGTDPTNACNIDRVRQPSVGMSVA